MRYFALALQMCVEVVRIRKYRIAWLTCVTMPSSLLFVGTEVAADFGYTRRACVIWYIYQEVAVSVLIVSVEFILVVRGTFFRA